MIVSLQTRIGLLIEGWDQKKRCRGRQTREENQTRESSDASWDTTGFWRRRWWRRRETRNKVEQQRVQTDLKSCLRFKASSWCLSLPSLPSSFLSQFCAVLFLLRLLLLIRVQCTITFCIRCWFKRHVSVHFQLHHLHRCFWFRCTCLVCSRFTLSLSLPSSLDFSLPSPPDAFLFLRFLPSRPCLHEQVCR